MTETKVPQKPREIAFRRWILFARAMRWAPLAAAMVVFGLIAAGRLPEHWAHLEYLVAITLPLLGLCLFAGWMAGRRHEAMTKEWGHRKAARWGVVPYDLPAKDDR